MCWHVGSFQNYNANFSIKVKSSMLIVCFCICLPVASILRSSTQHLEANIPSHEGNNIIQLWMAESSERKIQVLRAGAVTKVKLETHVAKSAQRSLWSIQIVKAQLWRWLGHSQIPKTPAKSFNRHVRCSVLYIISFLNIKQLVTQCHLALPW